MEEKKKGTAKKKKTNTPALTKTKTKTKCFHAHLTKDSGVARERQKNM